MTIVRIPVDITWSGASGSPGVNIFHGRLDSLTPGPNEVQSLTDILEEFYGALLSLFTTTTVVSYAGEVQGVGPDQGDTFTSPSWSLTGTGSNGHMPPADCMLVAWSAMTGGRSGRGRTFLGPLDRGAEENNGTPAELFRGAAQDAADALIESSDSIGNGALGIWSREQSVFRDFVNADVPNYFAVLRSRRD